MSNCPYNMFDENEKIKILSLDFDDCIIPWSLVDNGSDFQKILQDKDKYKILKQAVLRNLDIIQALQKKLEFKIAIHSSWGGIWDLDDDCDGFDSLSIWFRNQVNKRFNVFAIDKKNNRVEFLLNLKEKYPNSIIVALDDYDLSKLVKNRIVYIPTYGVVNKKIKEKILNSFKKITRTRDRYE